MGEPARKTIHPHPTPEKEPEPIAKLSQVAREQIIAAFGTIDFDPEYDPFMPRSAAS